ncbi:hypothetical protein ACOMHN_064746 [Nucella lapillus]
MIRFIIQQLICLIIGATLSPCGEDNTAEVVEGRRVNTFTCTGLANGQQVDWTVLYNQTPSSVASCPAGSTSSTKCTRGDLGAIFTASRVSGTESRVVADPTVLNKKKYVQYGTLKCADQNSNGASCQMDYIVPVGGTCSIQTGTGSSQFQLDGKCNLNAGAKSSRKRFKCVWLRSGDGDPWQQNVVLNENNYQSECKLTSDIPTDPGVYTYRVQLFPGLSTVTAGTVQIAKPEAPTLSGCGGEDYVRENTNVTCTCSTNAIGQPQGRLQWVKIGDSSVKKEGSYGASSLTVSLMLVRLDHQSTQFLCILDWATDILGTTVKFNVGYPPTKVFCGINGQQNDLTVNEYQSVRFCCQKDDGRPDPSLSLVKKDNNTVLLTNTSLLIHVVVSRCEDSGQYQCTAENGMGPKVTSTSRSFVVKCSPRGPQDLGDVNFINDPVSTTFDVTAYPAPTQVTFTFLGPTGNSTQPSAADESQIQLAGSCQAIAGGAIYLFTCTVTVNITSETTAGVYEVKVTNSRGNGLFRLKVLYKGGRNSKDRDNSSNDNSSNDNSSNDNDNSSNDNSSNDNSDDGREGKLAAMVGGITGGVAIVIIVALVIVIVKNRCDPLYAIPRLSGRNEEDHTYTELGHFQQTTPPDRPTFLYFTINYGHSDQNVSEHQVVLFFRCSSFNGRPDPTLSLVKKDNDTVLLTETSFLYHTVVSRCEDSGLYQCTAENGVGPNVTGNPQSLFVQCSPRGPQDLGDVHFINEPVSTTFDVTAYPAPTQVTFTFLGPVTNGVLSWGSSCPWEVGGGGGVPPEVFFYYSTACVRPTGNSTQPSAVDKSQIQLAGGCQAIAGGAIYLFTCMVTVNNVTSETAAGVYQVNVTNSQGDGQFHLKVLYKGKT